MSTGITLHAICTVATGVITMPDDTADTARGRAMANVGRTYINTRGTSTDQEG
jgi:hypothetical protein